MPSLNRTKTKTKTPPKGSIMNNNKKKERKKRDLHRVCKHGRRQMYCVECYKDPEQRQYATGICQHFARRYRCPICKGTSVKKKETQKIVTEFQNKHSELVKNVEPQQENKPNVNDKEKEVIIPKQIIPAPQITRKIPIVKLKPIRSRSRKLLRPRVFEDDLERYLYDMSKREYNPSNEFINLNFYKNVGKKVTGTSPKPYTTKFNKQTQSSSTAKKVTGRCPHGYGRKVECKRCEPSGNKIYQTELEALLRNVKNDPKSKQKLKKLEDYIKFKNLSGTRLAQYMKNEKEIETKQPQIEEQKINEKHKSYEHDDDNEPINKIIKKTKNVFNPTDEQLKIVEQLRSDYVNASDYERTEITKEFLKEYKKYCNMIGKNYTRDLGMDQLDFPDKPLNVRPTVKRQKANETRKSPKKPIQSKSPKKTTQTKISSPKSNKTQIKLPSPLSNKTQTKISSPKSNKTQTKLPSPSSNRTQTKLPSPSSNKTQTKIPSPVQTQTKLPSPKFSSFNNTKTNIPTSSTMTKFSPIQEEDEEGPMRRNKRKYITKTPTSPVNVSPPSSITPHKIATPPQIKEEQEMPSSPASSIGGDLW